MPVSALPQEIIDRVIDELGYSTKKTDLSQVALIAHSFLHRTQFHLFRSIDVVPSHSLCIIQNSQDWNAFHTILFKSPTIKFCIREIFLNNIIYYDKLQVELDSQSSYPCPMHPTNSKEHHIVTPRMMKKFFRRTMSHISSIFLNLPCLRAVRLNGPAFTTRMNFTPSLKDSKNIIVFCASISSMTTLTLSNLSDVPIDILDSILQLSQLTALLIINVRLDDHVQWGQHTRRSYLTNLKVFGFKQENPIHHEHALSIMTKIATLIFHSASQTLRKLIWCDKTGGHFDVRRLANLEVFSTGVSYNYYEFTLRPVLHEIIASQSQTIEVLELFGMENNWLTLDVASTYWAELDNLLDDRSFSHLKEIRLLFDSEGYSFLASPKSRYRDEFLEPELEGFTSEDVVSLFKSFALKSSERGVRITHGLTDGQDGLLPSIHY